MARKAALAPVNEQVRSADDPWVKWVKDQVLKQSVKNSFTVILRSGDLQISPDDPVRLAAFQKKMDEVDFWKTAEFPPFFPIPNDACPSDKPERIEITAIRGTTTKTLAWLNTSCPQDPNFKPAQKFLDLMGLIKQAAPAKP